MVDGLWGVLVIQGMFSSCVHILGTVCVLRNVLQFSASLAVRGTWWTVTKIVW